MHIDDRYYSAVPIEVNDRLALQAYHLCERLRAAKYAIYNQTSRRYQRLEELTERAAGRFLRRLD